MEASTAPRCCQWLDSEAFSNAVGSRNSLGDTSSPPRDEQSLPASSSTESALPLIPHFPPLDALPDEILLNIINNLPDTPSVVCLALTNHKFNAIISHTFKVDRLAQICPKDVRTKVPKALASVSYNILISSKTPGSHEDSQTQHETDHAGRCYAKGCAWEIAKYHPIPSPQENIGTEDPLRIQSWIQRLAYARRVAWLNPEPITLPSAHAFMRDMHAISFMTNPAIKAFDACMAVFVWAWASDSLDDVERRPATQNPSDLNRDVPELMPERECQLYFKWCFDAGYDFGAIVPESRISRLAALLVEKDVVESVEYMVLRGLLKGWMAKC